MDERQQIIDAARRSIADIYGKPLPIIEYFNNYYIPTAHLKFKKWMLNNLSGWKIIAVRGDGSCLIYALDATLPYNRRVPIEKGEEWFNASEWKMALLLEGEGAPGDLMDGCKNDLSMGWLNILVENMNIQVIVWYEENGDVTKYEYGPTSGKVLSTHYLLRHNNHFWALVPPTKEIIDVTRRPPVFPKKLPPKILPKPVFPKKPIPVIDATTKGVPKYGSIIGIGTGTYDITWYGNRDTWPSDWVEDNFIRGSAPGNCLMCLFFSFIKAMKYSVNHIVNAEVTVSEARKLKDNVTEALLKDKDMFRFSETEYKTAVDLIQTDKAQDDIVLRAILCYFERFQKKYGIRIAVWEGEMWNIYRCSNQMFAPVTLFFINEHNVHFDPLYPKKPFPVRVATLGENWKSVLPANPDYEVTVFQTMPFEERRQFDVVLNCREALLEDENFTIWAIKIGLPGGAIVFNPLNGYIEKKTLKVLKNFEVSKPFQAYSI